MMATTIISFQEQVQGWLAYLNRARKPELIVAGYARLEIIWRSFLKMNVEAFSDDAQAGATPDEQNRYGTPRIEARQAGRDRRKFSCALTLGRAARARAMFALALDFPGHPSSRGLMGRIARGRNAAHYKERGQICL